MGTLYATPGIASETSLSGGPRTPPVTPARAKRRPDRSGSPASKTSSIHPTETVSPAKKDTGKSPAPHDDLHVEELTEGDAGYMGDLDVVDPDEVEEVGSSDSDGDKDSTVSDASDRETKSLSRRLSRLHCGDEREEAEFEERRRRRRFEKRVDSRAYKRPHIDTVKGEMENGPVEPDPDAMDDHDLSGSQRRLRRRTKGPREAEIVFEDIPRSSPEAGILGSGRLPRVEVVHPVDSDHMDVDSGIM